MSWLGCRQAGAELPGEVRALLPGMLDGAELGLGDQHERGLRGVLTAFLNKEVAALASIPSVCPHRQLSIAGAEQALTGPLKSLLTAQRLQLSSHCNWLAT